MRSLVFRGESALSLTKKMRKGLATIREEKQLAQAQENVVMLLDVSGSMGEYVEDKRKIDHLREAVRGYPSLRKVSFSSGIFDRSIPEPNGGTDMGRGFAYLRTAVGNIREVILISDGLPDDPEEALAEAKALRCPVNVIYIGPGGDVGEAFMQRLAAETGGRQVTVKTEEEDFSRVLQDSVRLMLPKPERR